MLAFKNPALSTLVPAVLTIFGIQAAVAVPSIIGQSEKYYDLSGSATYLAATGISLYLPWLRSLSYARVHSLPAPPAPGLADFGARKLILSGMVAIWAIRLGSFLFARIKKDGKDSRFDEIKPNPAKFFGAFMAQAVWVTLVSAPVLLANAVPKRAMPALGLLDYVGMAVWVAGMGFEVVADRQKSAWRQRKEEKKHSEEFINEGLWKLSRHPNYFGESTLWTGTSVLALSALAGTSVYPSYVGALGFVSPLFVTFLTRYVSGVPMLEEKADKKFGPAWQKYKKEVPVFIPKFA
jgi:steroid 5-alpha reductase family enzyme